jgi:hypothetical protein
MITERDGWLMVPYDGPEIAEIELGFDGQYCPAYLDWDDSGQRVAQARATPERRAAAHVAVRVDGARHSIARASTARTGAARGSTAGSMAVSRTTVT